MPSHLKPARIAAALLLALCLVLHVGGVWLSYTTYVLLLAGIPLGLVAILMAVTRPADKPALKILAVVAILVVGPGALSLVAGAIGFDLHRAYPLSTRSAWWRVTAGTSVVWILPMAAAIARLATGVRGARRATVPAAEPATKPAVNAAAYVLFACGALGWPELPATLATLGYETGGGGPGIVVLLPWFLVCLSLQARAFAALARPLAARELRVAARLLAGVAIVVLATVVAASLGVFPVERSYQSFAFAFAFAFASNPGWDLFGLRALGVPWALLALGWIGAAAWLHRRARGPSLPPPATRA